MGLCGIALLRSVKSMQTFHFPFFFLTTTTLASHSRYWTSLTGSFVRSFSASLIMILISSGGNHLSFYLAGFAHSLTFSWCVMVAKLIPLMSLCDQAKQSWLLLTEAIISSLSYPSKFASVSTFVSFLSSSGISSTSVSTAALGVCGYCYDCYFFSSLKSKPVGMFHWRALFPFNFPDTLGSWKLYELVVSGWDCFHHMYPGSA